MARAAAARRSGLTAAGTSGFTHGLADALKGAGYDVHQKRPRADMNISCHGHSGNKPETLRDISKIELLQFHPGFVVGLGRRALFRCRESPLADPAQLAFGHSVLDEIECVELDLDRIAGANEADIARLDPYLGLHRP